MIQAITETGFNIDIQTEDNRIDTSVKSTQIRHLIKFTNDLDKSVQYAYGATETIKDRYTSLNILYQSTSPNIWEGETKLFPSGYWKYEVYEVSWSGTVTVSLGYAPATEEDVLPVGPNVGVVQGLVTKGKMYLAEKDGTEQVQYTQREAAEERNYIYYGQ